MKRFSVSSRRRSGARFYSRLPLAAAALLLAGAVPARADTTWTGATNANWSNSGNWNNGTPATAPYGTLFFATSTNSPSNDDLAGTISENKLLFNTTGAFTINGTGALSLFDNGGTQAKVENNSGTTSGTATLNFATLNFAATAGATYAEVNAVTGGITFASGNTLNVNGSNVAGVRMFGGGNTTTFSNTVNASGKYFDTINVGNNVVINGTFTSGNFFVMNSGTLSYTGGTFTTNGVRLGGDFSTSGAQDLTQSATFNVGTAGSAGGLTFASTINSVLGNTSGTLAINSLNTSNTNTLSGQIALDSNLRIAQTAGGTLAITALHTDGATAATGTDIKGQTLSFTGAGKTNVSGDIYSSNGTGAVVNSGTGTLTLSGTATHTGATSVTGGGKLVVDSAGTTTPRLTASSGITVAGAASVLQLANSSGTASLDRIGNAVPLTLAGGTLNTAGLSEHGGTASGPGVTAGLGALSLSASSIIDLGSGASILAFANSSAATWAAGTTLSIYNWSGFTTPGGGIDEVFFGTSAAGLTSGQVAQIRFYSDAGTTLIGGTTNMILSDGEVVPVPEPATWLAGFLAIAALGYAKRRSLSAMLARVSPTARA